MSNTELKSLLEKYKAGNITPEELALLETWYLEWQPEDTNIGYDEIEAVKNEVWEQINHGAEKKTRINWLLTTSIAACLLIAFFLFTDNPFAGSDPVKKQAYTSIKAEALLPGEDKAILTLSNGKDIILKNRPQGMLAEEDGLQVNMPEVGRLVYEKINAIDGNDRNINYNKVTTPRGGQFHVVLSDGTKVWLNAASSITYPVVFKGKERNVKTNGEVYFEVAHNKKMPFKVTSENQEITVLGTHFNVSAYADDLASNTALVSGKVLVKNTSSGVTRTLQPGQNATVIHGDGRIAVNPVNIEQAMAWRNGYFIFDNQDIRTIMKTLSRWYDVDVEFKSDENKERFGGTFSRSGNLLETLKNIEQLSEVRFKILGKKIIVSE